MTDKVMMNIKKLAMLLAVSGLCGAARAEELNDGTFWIESTTGTLVSYYGMGGDVVIPAKVCGVDVKAIVFSAFHGTYDHLQLTSVTIPEGVTNIGENAFRELSSLTNVTFAAGSQLKNIGELAFGGCEKLENVTFPAECPLETIGMQAFWHAALTSVTIPASVTNVGNRAFVQCNSLTNVTFAEGSQLKRIEIYAFSECEKLARVDFPAGCPLETIGERAFDSAGLTSVMIPACVTNIGEEAFAYGSGPMSVTFEEGSRLETIPASAFCYSGLANITIPAGVKRIEPRAFQNCKKLVSVTFEGGCLLENIGTEAFQSSGLTGITIPANVTNIETRAFQGCEKLASVAFAEDGKLKEIGASLFSSCIALTGITLPEGLTDIGMAAFLLCGELTEITIPASVTNIGDVAFAMCSKLEEVTMLATEPPTVGEKLFIADGTEATIASLKAIKVPTESVDKYKGADGWDTYAALITDGAASAAEAVEYFAWDAAKKQLVAKTCTVYTVVTPETETLTSGWYVVNSVVSNFTGLVVKGDAYLILADGAELYANGGTYAGICVNVVEGGATNSISIYGQANDTGKLIAIGGEEGAGIGAQCTEEYDINDSGVLPIDCGVINIHGGDISASTMDGAGIGGFDYSEVHCSNYGGTITIYGGKVSAVGGDNGAGIGSAGYSGLGDYGDAPSCRVTIYGGVITAGSMEEMSVTGIGGGMGRNGGIVTIYDGTVQAVGVMGAGIGGGYGGAGGDITIQDGDIQAFSIVGAGIGGGLMGAGGTVTINDGEVTAIAYPLEQDGELYQGEGIGAGANVYPAMPLDSGTLDLSGYEVTHYIYAGMDENGVEVTEVQADNFATWHTNCYVQITQTKRQGPAKVKIVSAKSARTEGAWSGAAQVVYELSDLHGGRNYALTFELAAAGLAGSCTTNLPPAVVDGIYTQEIYRTEFFGPESQVQDPAAELTLKLIEKAKAGK